MAQGSKAWMPSYLAVMGEFILMGKKMKISSSTGIGHPITCFRRKFPIIKWSVSGGGMCLDERQKVSCGKLTAHKVDTWLRKMCQENILELFSQNFVIYT